MVGKSEYDKNGDGTLRSAEYRASLVRVSMPIEGLVVRSNGISGTMPVDSLEIHARHPLGNTTLRGSLLFPCPSPLAARASLVGHARVTNWARVRLWRPGGHKPATHNTLAEIAPVIYQQFVKRLGSRGWRGWGRYRLHGVCLRSCRMLRAGSGVEAS